MGPKAAAAPPTLAAAPRPTRGGFVRRRRYRKVPAEADSLPAEIPGKLLVDPATTGGNTSPSASILMWSSALSVSSLLMRTPIVGFRAQPKFSMKMGAKSYPDADSFNTVAEITGSKYPEQVSEDKGKGWTVWEQDVALKFQFLEIV